MTIDVLEANLLFGVGCAVIQVHELHLVKSLAAQEDLVRAEVSMDHVLVVDELKQVDDLEADIDRFNFCEESWLTLGLSLLICGESRGIHIGLRRLI